MKKSETGLLGGTPKKLLSPGIPIKLLFSNLRPEEQDLASSTTHPYSIRAKL